MQGKRDRTDNGLTLLPPLEQLVPGDHHLRKIDKVLDLSFVHGALNEKYCQNNGRPSIDPEVVMRLFILQALENIPSVRKLMRDVQVNLAYRWFIGYRLDEELPDHSTLSRALDRMGDEVFDQLFKRSVAQCQKSGLLGGKVLHLDATTIRADLSRDKVDKPKRSGRTDKDAKFGRFPDGKIKPGYKQNTLADEQSRVIVGVDVKPANIHDSDKMSSLVDDAIDCLGVVPEAVCADTAYGNAKNCFDLEERGIRLVSPPQKALGSEKYFTVDDFVYEESADVFTCPAGNRLKFIGYDSERPNRKRYRTQRTHCSVCKLLPRCTRSKRREIKVSEHYNSLLRLRKDSQTRRFKELYRRRAPVIEGVFAEAKQWHGLRRAWRRGLLKMRVQSLLIASVINYKRLGALRRLVLLMKEKFEVVLSATRRYLSEFFKQSQRQRINKTSKP